MRKNLDISFKRKGICIFIVCLLIVTTFSVVTPATPTRDDNISEIDFSVTDEEINKSDKDPFENGNEIQNSNPLMKIQPTLREMINNRVEGQIKIVISTEDVRELALLMDDYDYDGLIGTKSTTSDRFVPIVLEVPINCLHSIANLKSVIGVYKYQSPCKSADGFTEKTFRNFEEPNGDLTKENMMDPDILQMPDPIDPMMKDAISIHHAQEAWSNGFTGEGINIAIPDTGIDFGHPDLQGQQARVSDLSSPYYGWPIVFDQVSMSDFLRTGSANDTWYVNTSYSATATVTVADTVIDTDDDWDTLLEIVNETVYGPAVGDGLEKVFYLEHEDVFIGTCTLYTKDGTAWEKLEKDIDYNLYYTGRINLYESLDSGMFLYAYYNYTNPNIIEITEGIPLPSPAGTPETMVVSGLTPGAQHFFAIRAKDEANNIAGISDNANAIAGMDAIPPSTITDLMVEPGPDHGSIWINWTAPGDDGLTGTVDSYVIKYSTLPIPNRACFDFIERDYIININGNLPGGVFESRVISALPAGETFYFSIIAMDEAGNEGDISNCPSSVQVQNDITPPAAITDLTVTTGLQHREVDLTWTAPGDDGADGTATLYIIKYSTTPITTQAEFDGATEIGNVLLPKSGGNIETLTVKTSVAGLTYYFAIEAEDETGNYGVLSSGPSLSAIAMEDTDPPGQISDLNAVPGPDHATVRLFWNATGDDAAVGQATKYVIKYHTADDYGSALVYKQLLVDTWTPKTSGEAEEFVLESIMGGFIAPNTMYYFWVQAVDDGANIGAVPTSASVTSTEDSIAPEAINDLTTVVADDHGHIILEWTAPHDDGGSGGACTQYVIKNSLTPITDEATFAAATQLIKDIDPLPPGTLESHVFGPSFDPGTTLYFAIKAVDDAGSYGPLGGGLPVSGVLRNDVTPPSTITDLAAVTADENGEIILTWTSPGDDGAIGTASQYLVRYREAISEYLHVPYEKNQTSDDIWYNVTGIQSMSGMYRLGVHPDTNLAFLISDPVYPEMSDYSRVLLVDSSTAGVYDTVYVDLDHDQDFSDEKACFKGDETSWADTDDDGMADRSGGMIYFIANGIDPIPYSDTFSSKHGIDNIIPENSTIVCFTGEFNLNENHGTLCASSIAAQGKVEDGLVVGMAPDSKLISIPNFYEAYSVFDCLDFAVEGYDGMPGTGDEAQIVSNSYGWTYDNDGWDYTSRYMDNLVTQYAQGKSTFAVASIENGNGYGTMTSPASAPGVITCGAATSKLYRVDQSYDGGPNPAYGDVAPFSGRGPSALGQLKPDVMGVGAFAYGDHPLNQEGTETYGHGWEIWNGPGLSTPITAGALAMIFDAYDQAEGSYPMSELAKRLLMSGCDDMNNDVLAQGAGFVNADRSTKMANDLDGISTSISSWNPGDFRGIEHEAFAKLMYPGDDRSTNITLENHDQTAAESVIISDAVLQRTGESHYSLDLACREHRWSIINETGIYDRNGIKFGSVDANLWNNADMIKVTAYANFTDLDIDRDGFLDTSYWLELHDWTDVNGNGKFDGDLEPDPYEGAIGFYERNRIMCDWSGFGPTTLLEARVYNPSERTHDGLLIWNREINTIFTTNTTVWQVKCEFYQKTDWNWLTTDQNNLNINAGGSETFNADLSVPSDAGIGLYEGAIYLNKENTAVGEVLALEHMAFEEYNELVVNTTPTNAQLAHGNILGLSDLWKEGTFYVENETTYTATAADEASGLDITFFTGNSPLIDHTLYFDGTISDDGWIWLEEGVDYNIDLATGQIDTLWGDVVEGWVYHTYYNYSGLMHLATPVDYTLDSLTGAITLLTPLVPGEPLLANYTWFIPDNIAQLQHGDVILGSHTIYKNSMPMVENTDYTINLKSGKITFLDYLIPSDILTADYAYQTERSTIPVVVNIAANSLPFTFGGNSGTFDLYDNNRVYGGSIESNDWRYYFVDIPDTTETGAGHKLLIDVNWSNTPSDIDVFIYGQGQRDQFSWDNETRYGPYPLEYKGGSEIGSQYYTTTGTSREIITAELTTGLNLIMLRNTILNGSANYEEFSGTVGAMYIEPSPINILTNKLYDSIPVTINSTLDWEGVDTEIYGSHVDTYTDQEVWQDDPNWENYASFEDQLASGNTTIPINLTSVSTLNVHIWGHPDAPDLDLGLFLDGKSGNPIDGQTQVGEFVALGADADADEEIAIFFPEDGTYLIRIYGFTLYGEPGHYDMQVTRVSPLYAPHLYVEDLDDGFLPANTSRTFNLTWDFPGSTPDGLHLADLFVGPKGAAMCCQDPITLLLDRVPPEITNLQPADGSTIYENLPIIGAEYSDELSGVDVENVKISFDGIDVTADAVIGESSIAYVPTEPLGIGLHVVELDVPDIVGNTNSTVWLFTVEDNTAPAISHAPVAMANVGDVIIISAGVTDDFGVNSVVLYYKNVGDGEFTSTLMVSGENDTYTAIIPAQLITGNVTYYIAADDSENTARHPDIGEHIIQINPLGTPVITHSPVEESSVGNIIPIYATVTDDIGITGVVLYYKNVGDAAFSSLAMDNGDSGDDYLGIIPKQSIEGWVYYYIEATDGTNTVTHPVDTMAPHEVWTNLYGGILRIAQQEDIQTLNPMIAGDEWTWNVLEYIYDVPIREDANTSDLIPFIANGSNNGTVVFGFDPKAGWSDINKPEVTIHYDFTNVLFHDGHQMDIDDIIFSYHLMAQHPDWTYGVQCLKDLGGGDGSNFTDTHWLHIYKVYESPDKLNASLKFVLQAPRSDFFRNTLTPLILPKHIWGTTQSGQPFDNMKVWCDIGYVPANPDAWDVSQAYVWDNPDPIGSGLFEFNEWVPGEYLRVDTYTDYFYGRAKIDGINYTIWPSTGLATLGLRNDKIDYIGWTIPPYLMSGLEADENISIAQTSERGFIYMSYNMRFESFGYADYDGGNYTDIGNPFRKAVTHCIDKQTIVQNLLQGYAIPGYGPVSSNSEWYNETIPTYSFDPVEAKHILYRAGYQLTDGSHTLPDNEACAAAGPGNWWLNPDGSPIGNSAGGKIEILTPPADYDPIRAQAGLMIANQLQQVGIYAESRSMDFGEIVTRIDARDFDMYILGWNIGSEPPDYLYAFFHSDNAATGQNYPGYTNASFDALIDHARTTYDENEMYQDVRDAQASIAWNLPYDVLYYKNLLEAYRSDNYEGWHEQLGGIYNFWSFIDLSMIEPPVIAHLPVKTAGTFTPITIDATVTDNVNIFDVSLHYKNIGDTNFTVVEMNNIGNDEYTADIPSQTINGKVCYYIEASDGTRNTTHPRTMPDTYPHEINIIFMLPTFNISLELGWNLISFPLIQTDESLDEVLCSIDGKWDYIQVYNASDSTDHWKSNNSFRPDQLNDLKTLNHMMGFWINITEACTLTVSGNTSNLTSITLYAGWNLVSYPSLISETVGNAMFGTGADKVEAFNASQPYNLIEVGPAYVMQPGEGYWIHVPANTVWTVDW